jgi:hypothetical protein
MERAVILMSWIPKKNSSQATLAPSPAVPHAQSSASLDTPVVLTVQRFSAPVNATLMDINAHGARLRSFVLMEQATEVTFNLNVGGHAALTVNGRIESRHTTGARFEYRLSFRTMAEAQIEAVARSVRDAERRAASARAIERQIEALPTTADERRGSYRALSSIPLRFRTQGGEWVEGKVGDISVTGVRINCAQPIQIGSEIEMRFTLPNDVLRVYPEETLTIDTSSGTPRRVSSRPDMRRPFSEMAIRAKVVTRFPAVRDRGVYGVSFIAIDGNYREEIARYTHAVQLSKIRK